MCRQAQSVTHTPWQGRACAALSRAMRMVASDDTSGTGIYSGETDPVASIVAVTFGPWRARNALNARGLQTASQHGSHAHKADRPPSSIDCDSSRNKAARKAPAISLWIRRGSGHGRHDLSRTLSYTK